MRDPPFGVRWCGQPRHRSPPGGRNRPGTGAGGASTGALAAVCRNWGVSVGAVAGQKGPRQGQAVGRGFLSTRVRGSGAGVHPVNSCHKRLCRSVGLVFHVRVVFPCFSVSYAGVAQAVLKGSRLGQTGLRGQAQCGS